MLKEPIKQDFYAIEECYKTDYTKFIEIMDSIRVAITNGDIFQIMDTKPASLTINKQVFPLDIPHEYIATISSIDELDEFITEYFPAK